MRPFEEHRTRLKEISDIAFTTGVRSLNEDQQKRFPKGLTKKEIESFIQKCHDGFKEAQKKLIEEIRYYQQLNREYKNQLKEARTLRDKESEKDLMYKIEATKFRLSTFSHIADAIAWQMIGGQIHVARRLHVKNEEPKQLDSSNIEHAIEVADEINKNPNDFALISDITGYIQLGDLLVKHKEIIGILELKEGKVNDQIAEFLQKLEKESKELNQDELSKHFDKKTAKQITRVHKQKQRAIQATEIINTDKGIDPSSGKPIVLSTPKVHTENYHVELEKLHRDLSSKAWSYGVVDSCVLIGMYRDEALPMGPFLIEQILKSQTEDFLVTDWHSIVDNVSEPIFLKPFSPDFIIDVLIGKIKVIVGLDMNELINQFNKRGLPTKWLSRKEAGKIKSENNNGSTIFINNKCVSFTLPKQGEIIMGGGIISKIIYDNIRPTNIADSLLSVDKE